MKFLWSFIDLMNVEKCGKFIIYLKLFEFCKNVLRNSMLLLIICLIFLQKNHNFFEKIRQKILLRKMSSIQYRVKLFDVLSTTATFKILPIFCEMRWVFIAKRIISCNCREMANFRFLDFINS